MFATIINANEEGQYHDVYPTKFSFWRTVMKNSSYELVHIPAKSRPQHVVGRTDTCPVKTIFYDRVYSTYFFDANDSVLREYRVRSGRLIFKGSSNP